MEEDSVLNVKTLRTQKARELSKIGESKGLLEEATAKIEKLFDSINENSHPIGTRTWLVYWRDTKKASLAVLGDLERQLRQLWKERPKTRGYNNLFYKCDELKKWFEDFQKRVFGEG